MILFLAQLGSVSKYFGSVGISGFWLGSLGVSGAQRGSVQGSIMLYLILFYTYNNSGLWVAKIVETVKYLAVDRVRQVIVKYSVRPSKYYLDRLVSGRYGQVIVVCQVVVSIGLNIFQKVEKSIFRISYLQKFVLNEFTDFAIY